MRRALASLPGAIALASRPAAAHVDYVTDDEGSVQSTGELLRHVAADPVALALIGGGALTAVAIAVGYLAYAARVPDVAATRRTLASYRPYLPWMLRLSVGLPLVGAGFAGYLFAPTLAVEARLVQVTIGFLLLFGLGSRLLSVAGLTLYAWALAVHGTELLLASEYVAGFAAIVLVGSGQPSADGLLRRLVVTDGTLASRLRPIEGVGRRVLQRYGLDSAAVPVVLRVFLGANFLYLGVAQKWLQPASASAVVAKYDLTHVVPVDPATWVFGAGLVEAAVGLLLLVGLFSRGAAIAAFLLLTTTLFGLPDDPVLAHVTLFGLSSAIMVTGSGPYSVDQALLPAIGRTLRRRLGSGEAASA